MTQIEFLDDLGRQLDGAAGRLIRARRTTRHRALLVPAAAVTAVTVVAALAVALWPGAPADPEREVAAPQGAQTVRELLAVLRRPESDADRGAAAQAGRDALARLMPADATFRLLAETPEGGGIVLGAGPVERPGGGTDDGGVCLHLPEAGGGGGSCWTAEDVARGRGYGGVGDTLAGVARDGVANVEVQWAGSKAIRGTVEDNLFRVGTPGREPVLSVTMLDQDGRVVSTHHPAAAGVQVVPVPEETLRQAEALAEAADLEHPGERLRSNAEDAAVAAEIAGQVPHPPGMPADMDWAATPEDPADMASINFRTEVQMIVEFRARCAWMRFWLAAHDAAAPGPLRAATQVLSTTPRWPSLRTRPGDDDRIGEAARGNAAGVVAQDFSSGCGDGVRPRPRGRAARR